MRMMKYLRPALVLGLLLISPLPGRADTPKTPQATLAAVMEGAGQALLYDRIQDTYVLVRVGDWFQGYRVGAIERDQLILTAPPSPIQFVLPKVSDLIRLDDAAHPVQPAGRSGPQPKVTRLDPSKLTPLDPYGEPAGKVIDPYGKPAGKVIDPYPEKPVDPYADQVLDPYADQPVTTVVAPEGSRAASTDGLAVAPASPPPVLAPTTEVTPSQPAPAATPAPAPAAEPERVHPLTRAEFDAALDDFDSLSKEVQLSVGRNGVTIAELAPGTFLHRLGLRKGDRVLRVAGQPINDLDAAAAVYARLMVVDEFTVAVVRDRRTVTLRYRFTR